MKVLSILMIYKHEFASEQKMKFRECKITYKILRERLRTTAFREVFQISEQLRAEIPGQRRALPWQRVQGKEIIIFWWLWEFSSRSINTRPSFKCNKVFFFLLSPLLGLFFACDFSRFYFYIWLVFVYLFTLWFHYVYFNERIFLYC